VLDLIAFMLKETKSLVSNSVFDSSRMLANMSNSKNLLYSSRALSVIHRSLVEKRHISVFQDLSRQVLDGEVDDSSKLFALHVCFRKKSCKA